MTITINGAPVDPPEGTIGQILSVIDQELERVGLAISGIEIDGEKEDAESLRDKKDLPHDSIGSIAIEAVRASDLRLKAFDLVSARLEECLSALGSDRLRDARESLARTAEAVSGVLSSDENAFLRFDGPRGESEGFESALRDAARIFAERMSEIVSPIQELAKTRAAFEASEARFSSVAVDLQTGRDREAVATLLLFVEVFNKALRLIPELRNAGVDIDAAKADGLPLGEFFEGLNGALKELTEGFERKDTVTVGDMAEYEVLPRLRSLFDALEQASSGIVPDAAKPEPGDASP